MHCLCPYSPIPKNTYAITRMITNIQDGIHMTCESIPLSDGIFCLFLAMYSIAFTCKTEQVPIRTNTSKLNNCNPSKIHILFLYNSRYIYIDVSKGKNSISSHLSEAIAGVYGPFEKSNTSNITFFPGFT